MTTRHARLAIFGIFFGATLAPSALAQTDAAKANAEAAFDLGKKLLAEGKTSEACPKFAESVRLDPGIGSWLYLADCHEKVGQTASAWAEFREAEALAKRNADARESVAHDRAAALEPKLTKLVVVVPAQVASTQGLEIKRDDGVLGQALWGAPIPVDPGMHHLIVSAPGKKPWSTDVNAAGDGSTAQVSVPPLEDAPAPPLPQGGPPKPPPDESSHSDGKTQRLLGLGAIGVGVVGVGIGTVFGLRAKSKNDDSNADGHCRAGNLCDGTGLQDRSDAQSAAMVSTVAFAVGLVAAAGGVVLYLTAPHASGPQVAVTSSATPRGGVVGLRGSF